MFWDPPIYIDGFVTEDMIDMLFTVLGRTRI